MAFAICGDPSSPVNLAVTLFRPIMIVFSKSTFRSALCVPSTPSGTGNVLQEICTPDINISRILAGYQRSI